MVGSSFWIVLYAISMFTIQIQVLLNASKVLKSSGIKKEVENDLLSCMALQVGLEPTTYGLTVRRSNQLSY
jgi:hypothetical protein